MNQNHFLSFIVTLVTFFGTLKARSIVDGKPSKVASVVGVLRLFPKSGIEFACTGVLISPRHVLTAEHCAPKELPDPDNVDKNGVMDPDNLKWIKLTPDNFGVYFGDGVLSPEKTVSDFKKRKQQIQKIKYVKVIAYHPFDQNVPEAADLAILTLEAPVASIAPALLPSANILSEALAFKRGGVQFLSVGYGNQYDDDPNKLSESDPMLTGAKLEISPLSLKIDSEYLNESNGREFEVVFVKNENTAQHDSGGPLFVRTGSKLVVVGIVKGIPYTSVYAHISWIRKVLKKPVK